jgi:RNA polymerase sigma factor (TIGR02999 family)
MIDLSGNRAPASEVTHLLLAWGNGDQAALNRLVPLVDAELHRIARRYIRKERSGHTLEPTALVNEAYLRLIEWKSVDWQNRAHFFAVAAKMMRHILVKHAIRRRRRIGDTCVITLPISPFLAAGRSMDILALDQALHKLAEFDERKCRLVEMRFFGGLTEEETAEAMASSLRTVQREWSIARAWLFRELSGPQTA